MRPVSYDAGFYMGTMFYHVVVNVVITYIFVKNEIF